MKPVFLRLSLVDSWLIQASQGFSFSEDTDKVPLRYPVAPFQ